MPTHPAADVPPTLFDDAERETRWRARFTATRVSLPTWARDNPERAVYLSNAGGVFEVHTWDRATDTHRRVTDRPQGTLGCAISADGDAVLWFDDTDGDEFGRWMRTPFTGPGSAGEALPGATDGYPAGLVVGAGAIAVGVADDSGTTVFVSRDGGPADVVYRDEHDGSVAALSRDESLLAIEHSEHGDSRHPALRVLNLDGTTVADKADGPGRGLSALAFSPVAGDQRLLVRHERGGRDALLIWDVAANTETELAVDLPGDLAGHWFPDAATVLVVQTHRGRNTLHRHDPATGSTRVLDTPPGMIEGASVRPDGSVEYAWASAASPGVVRVVHADGTGAVLLAAPGPAAAGSTPLLDADVETPGGSAHVLHARPSHAPDGPLPTLFSLHGGPHAQDRDRFLASRAAWLDAGFAVVHVNYRGSTGYGSQWRDAIAGRPGLTELEDLAAAHDWAVGAGLADPDRCVVGGGSWGGYLTLLALGTQPQRWAAGLAVVPVADYHTAYADEMEPLRAFDRALFGGSPDEVPDAYTASSPLTYVDQVRAPVLVVAGENDPRCPIRQIENYLDRLAAREHDYEVYTYDAGHGSLVAAETITQTAIQVHFARRALGLPMPGRTPGRPRRD